MHETNYYAFPRPTTRLNRIINRFLIKKSGTKIDMEVVEKWRANSLDTYGEFVTQPDALVCIERDPLWQVSNNPPPENVWFGEAKFSGVKDPKVIIYNDSFTTSLPTCLFNLAGQAGMDHIIGHLYPFYSGEDDFGEERACKLQYQAADLRSGPQWKAISIAIPLIYKLHKDIPISNYK